MHLNRKNVYLHQKKTKYTQNSQNLLFQYPYDITYRYLLESLIQFYKLQLHFKYSVKCLV